MKYISVCSGIEAATVAWHPLGWTPLLFAETERFPSAVLKHHYPEVPNVGDFTKLGDRVLRERGSMRLRISSGVSSAAKGLRATGSGTRSRYAKEQAAIAAADLLVGGTPCQDFSVAGLRAGMDGERGQLTIEFAKLAHRLAAGKRRLWVVWENVPGVLSIDGGMAFALFLSTLAKRTVSVPRGGWKNAGIVVGADDGFGLAYRVLDAQFAGVPQRRRRVFVVGYLGDWRRAAAVLLERHSLSGDTPPCRKTGESSTYDVAPSLTASGRGFDRPGDSRGQDCLIASTGRISHCLNAGAMGRIDYETETLIAHALRGEGFDASEDGTGRGIPLVAHTVTSNGDAHSGFKDERGLIPVPITIAMRGRGGEQNVEIRQDGTANAILTPNGGRGGIGVGAIAIQERAVCENPNAGPDGSGFRTDGIAYTLEARTVPQAVAIGIDEEHNAVEDGFGTLRAHHSGGFSASVMTPTMAVRRLTVRECERLQGFPDDYTLIRVGKKWAADGPRYKALGNSMAVPVMRWIGQRIQMVWNLYEKMSIDEKASR
jgi:DNA (cytosine-5)-methyltransferase 1